MLPAAYRGRDTLASAGDAGATVLQPECFLWAERIHLCTDIACRHAPRGTRDSLSRSLGQRDSAERTIPASLSDRSRSVQAAWGPTGGLFSRSSPPAPEPSPGCSVRPSPP